MFLNSYFGVLNVSYFTGMPGGMGGMGGKTSSISSILNYKSGQMYTNLSWLILPCF